MRYAGFWRRAGAVVIDLVLSAPFYYGLQAMFGKHDVRAEVIFILLFSAAYTWMFASAWQGSPGMRMMRVIITDTVGARISLLRSFWWVVTSFVGVAIAFGGILYLQARFDLDRVNELLAGMWTHGGDMESTMAEIEAITHMPFSEFYGLMLRATLLTLVLSVIWMISVGAGRQKAGFHNWICGTRMIVGRS